MVCSDSTIARRLAGGDLKPVRQMVGEGYQSQPIQQRKVGAHRLGRRAIEGIPLEHFQVSGCLILGRAAHLFLDAEPIPQRGRELAAGQRVLKRLTQRLGPGFVDLHMGSHPILTHGTASDQRTLILLRERNGFALPRGEQEE